jgi:hypothetical protein
MGYAVGLRSGFSPEIHGEIADPWHACAYFIKHEVEAIIGSPDHEPMQWEHAEGPVRPNHPPEPMPAPGAPRARRGSRHP